MKSQILALMLAVTAIAAPQLSQAAPWGQGHGGRHGGAVMNVDRLEKRGVQLTPEQKAKIEQIQANTQRKIDEVLTAEQRQARQNLQATRQNVQLSAEQKQKLRQSWQSSRQELKAILTPEQQQQLQQKRQGRQQRYGLRRQGRGQGGDRMDLVARLTAQGIQLTPEQRSKIEQLQSQEKATRASLFTPEQQQARTRMKAQRQAINITPTQKQQIRTIYKTARAEMKAVLTPAQQQQLQQKRQRHGRMQAS